MALRLPSSPRELPDMKNPSEEPSRDSRQRSQHIRRILVRVAAGTLATGALAACSSSSSGGSSGTSGGSNSSTYTIHAILSVTGRNSFLGVDEKASLMELQKLV